MFVITHYPFSRDSLFLSQGPYARKISATCNAYSTDGLARSLRPFNWLRREWGPKALTSQNPRYSPNPWPRDFRGNVIFCRKTPDGSPAHVNILGPGNN